MRTRTAQGAVALRMAGAVNFTYGANVPLAVNTNVAKVVALEARFMVAGVVLGEWSIDRYAVDSSRSIDFMTEFDALEG